MTDSANTDLMRVSLQIQQLAKDTGQLLKIVRDGNGTPALVNKVQALEHEGQHADRRHNELVREIGELRTSADATDLQIIELYQQFKATQVSLDQFMTETRKRQEDADKNQIRKSSLVWTAVASFAVALASNFVIDKLIREPNLNRPTIERAYEQQPRSASPNR